MLTLIASMAGTITGFGTSTLLVPILSLQFPLTETLLFVGVVHWFGDIWKMLFFKRGANWRLILLFGITGILVTFLGARLAGVFDETMLKQNALKSLLKPIKKGLKVLVLQEPYFGYIGEVDTIKGSSIVVKLDENQESVEIFIPNIIAILHPI